MGDGMQATVASLLKGIDRYNPENLSTLERYVAIQAEETSYDLEANLAILKLYQFNPSYYKLDVTAQILVKALTNLPHADFNLCKSLLDSSRMDEGTIKNICELSELLEGCQFKIFWKALQEAPDLVESINGFHQSIRKFICHVIGSTFQTTTKRSLSENLGDVSDEELDAWIEKYGWTAQGDTVFIANQDDLVKTKNITEKITFDSVKDIIRTHAVTTSH